MIYKFSMTSLTNLICWKKKLKIYSISKIKTYWISKAKTYQRSKVRTQKSLYKYHADRNYKKAWDMNKS